MGVNVKAYFAPGTRARNVATVAGALLGLPTQWKQFEGFGDSSSGHATNNAGVIANGQAGCAYIVIPLAGIDNPAAKAIHKSDGANYHLFYCYEGEHKEGGPEILPACIPVKIALCAELIRFFGGHCDFNDCDEQDVDLRVKPNPLRRASDGKEWEQLQQAILAVKPLTQKDINKYSNRG